MFIYTTKNKTIIVYLIELKSFPNIVFKKKNEIKKRRKKPLRAAFEPGAVGYDGICVTDGSNRENIYKGIINLHLY